MDDRVEHEAKAGTINPWASLADPVRAKEPPLRLAWPPTAVAIVLIAIYVFQISRVDPEAFATDLGFTPAAFVGGGWYGVFTAIFVHGSWGHVLVNSAFAIAFGSPVARRFGLSAVGGALFFLFFLVCGVAGNLGYALVHPNGVQPVVGASGAIAGLYAATSRLLWRGPGLAPLTSRAVVVMGAAWVTINLVIGLFHIDAGFGAAGAPVAWEAHIAGYLAGLLIVGLFDRAAPGPRSPLRND